MISLKKLQKKAGNAAHTSNVPVGKYNSVVLSVEEPKDFAPGEKAIIRYELTNDKGEKFSFKDEYLIRRATPRTYELFEYLAEYGIDDLEDFVGCEEEVEILMRSGRYGQNFASICSREMIAIPEELE